MARAEYAIFKGCMIPSLQPFVEVATKKVLEKLDVRLQDIKDETCCPVPEAPRALDDETWHIMAARNLALGERMGLNIMTVCSGCFETLEETNEILKENKALRDRVNERLASIGFQFQGKIRVQNVIEVLYDVVGTRKIGEAVTKPLTGIKVCPQVGCRLYKSEEKLNLPRKFREIAEAIGCTIVNYETERVCCGFPTIYADVNFGYVNRTKPKLDDIKNASSDGVVVICPACLNQFEMAQLDLRTKGFTYDIPCFNLLELMALSFGIHGASLGIQWHRIKPVELLKKIEGGK